MTARCAANALQTLCPASPVNGNHCPCAACSSKLNATGIEFDVIKGKGPLIASPIRSMDAVKALRPMDDPSTSLPFVAEILSVLRCAAALEGTYGLCPLFLCCWVCM